MKKKFIFNISSFLLFIFLSVTMFGQEENLNVLDGWMKYTDVSNSLYKHLSSQAVNLIDKRTRQIEQLKTKKDWIKKREQIRKTLLNIVGPFPEKTPLNERILDVVQKQNYRVEKIIYESMPKFYVTACIFIPNNLKGKTPAILYFSGHTSVAFRKPSYQQLILNLVMKGFIVLAVDPIGQGERLQYYDKEIDESEIGNPTEEHSYPGAQCFISGSSIARYFIWDGIRSIDYLLTRPEVDPDNIGCHGRSGGGTQSVYISAFDQRIKAVASADYITNFKRLFESIGPQDAEQNFYHGIASGIDHADLLEVRVPKPVLIAATTRDFFSIQGVRETFYEVKKAYNTFGKKENIKLVEDDFTHGYTKKNREAIYRFFQKHLGLTGDASEVEVEYLSSDELRITSTGQVSTALGGESIFSINKKETQFHLDNLDKSRQNLSFHLKNVRKSARKLSGFLQPDTTLKEVVFRGRYHRKGYVIEKYFMQGEGDYVIPFLVMVPKTSGAKPAVIYLHPEGKSKEADPGGTMDWLVKQGYIVLSPDLIGIGEMGPGVYKGDAYFFKLGHVSYNLWFAGIQIARSLTGIRAGDVIRCLNYLKSRKDVNIKKISAIAVGEMSPVLIHAAAFDSTISKAAFVEPFISYGSIVMNKYYKPNYVLSTVPGALTAYDLPDLAACLAPMKLLFINITDQNGKRASSQSVQKEFSIVKSAYSSETADSNLIIRNWEPYESMEKIFSRWIK